MTLFIYIMQVTLCLAFFYAFFWIALQKETTFQINRIYLLTAIIISLLLPIIKVYLEKPPEPSIVTYLSISTYVQPVEIGYVETSLDDNGNIDWMKFALTIYLFVALSLFIKLVIDFFNILSIRRNGQVLETNSGKCILSAQVKSPFSFFNQIYLPLDHQFNEEELKELVRHEEAHISGRHSVDILFIELVTVLLWISPVIYLFRKKLRELHEFIADATVIKHSEWEKYAQFLLAQSNYGLQHRLSNQLVYSQLKNRLIMMTQKPSPFLSRIKYLGIIPILVITLIMFSFREKPIVPNDTVSIFSIDTLPAVYINSISAKEESENDREVFTYVELMPRFGGCEHLPEGERGKCTTEALYNFIYKTINYPDEARESGIKGMVIVQFIVEANGELTNIKIVRGVSSELDEEALRVVNAMKDKWLPGYHHGIPVAVTFTLPIKFVLGEKKHEEGKIIPNEIYTVADEMPRFPGCEHLPEPERASCANEAMFKFLYESISYPKSEREQGIEGIVIARIIIEKDGSIAEPKIVRGISPGLDNEILRVINKMKDLPEKWIPGRHKGEAVPVMLTVPFKFALESEKIEKLKTGDTLPDLWGEIEVKDAQQPVENSWVKIKPNPASDIVEIEILVSIESIRIAGISKTIMWQMENVDQRSKYTINVSDWIPGKYIVYLYNGGVSKYAGFIVQH